MILSDRTLTLVAIIAIGLSLLAIVFVILGGARGGSQQSSYAGDDAVGALLDERGTGVVLTSINGRQETRVYAKPVTVGQSTYNLSREEEEAIRQAMHADEHQAAAR